MVTFQRVLNKGGDPQVCPNWSKFQLGANRYSLESQQVHRGGNHGQHIMRTQHTLFISYRSCLPPSSSRQSARLHVSVLDGDLHDLRAPSNGVVICRAIHPSANDRVGSRIPTRRLPTSWQSLDSRLRRYRSCSRPFLFDQVANSPVMSKAGRGCSVLALAVLVLVDCPRLPTTEQSSGRLSGWAMAYRCSELINS